MDNLESITPDLSDDQRSVLRKTYEALQRQWERERIRAENRYLIEIPAQTMNVIGDERALETLARLKEIGVRGTYRVVKGVLDDVTGQSRGLERADEG